MLGKKITVTVAQPEVQLAGEGRKVLYKGSVALGDHSSPKPVYLISYGDPKPEQPATVIAVVSSKGKEQFVAAPENTVYYAPEIRSVIEKAEGRPPERVSCLYEKSCGAVVYRVEGRTVRFLVVKKKNVRHWGFPKGHMEYCLLYTSHTRSVFRHSSRVLPGRISAAIAAEWVMPEQPMVSTRASWTMPSLTFRVSLQAPCWGAHQPMP